MCQNSRKIVAQNRDFDIQSKKAKLEWQDLEVLLGYLGKIECSSAYSSK